jgi:ubiquinol-cytochrome c reductase iron-sulfur subunit
MVSGVLDVSGPGDDMECQMTDVTDNNRRHFLGVATGVMGLVGVGFVAYPFLASWRPSARAQALGAPVEIDIGKLEVGSILRVEWRGSPVWVLRRSQQMLESLTLPEVAGRLRDPESSESEQPEYARNVHRSVREEYLVVIGSCTHLGCAPLERFEVAPADMGPDWRGGFFCPCHGSTFDLAGRVYAGVPAPLNLPIPPYMFTDDNTILVGSDTGA